MTKCRLPCSFTIPCGDHEHPVIAPDHIIMANEAMTEEEVQAQLGYSDEKHAETRDLGLEKLLLIRLEQFLVPTLLGTWFSDISDN